MFVYTGRDKQRDWRATDAPQNRNIEMQQEPLHGSQQTLVSRYGASRAACRVPCKLSFTGHNKIFPLFLTLLPWSLFHNFENWLHPG